MSIIEAEGLSKVYSASSGEVRALDGLDLAVEEGTVRGILGPNGAGKTTCVKILTTLIQPTAGSARVAGIDVLAQPARVRDVIGTSGQYAAVDEQLTARENLRLIGRLYHLGRTRVEERTDELLESFDLADAADRPVKGFSGGMRRRVDLAGALVAEPKVLFLDEPTTGLDPKARIGLWDVIRDRVGRGVTVLLTTQYLEEADQLADDISVIDDGRVIAEGTADQLKSRVGGQQVEVTAARMDDVAALRDALARHASGPVTVDGPSLRAPVIDGTTSLTRFLADVEGIELHDAGLRRPTLDEVFLSLTGDAPAGQEDPR
ncbi:ATP-binding cassette domain-containing protein [Corynebacterium xerosis]|uniref:ATP-binding cassette domain-containing protein n=1 Tax=Corynebacterium xerosis TaxID=1725 RepID=A0A6B8TK92_9CORY|nr:ATP-binding cassette domain-containing protein [Corynebacterium xerosis]QGS33922.1 ATP-binding cassette domain-containing protein [Corynebacterium xerosis]